MTGIRLVRGILEKNVHLWLAGWLRARGRGWRARKPAGKRHLLFAFCDHFEPLWKSQDRKRGEARVNAWHEGYPLLAARFRDADGRPPQHSFFFPGEEYEPVYLEKLADLARRRLGEVELHLHHDGDTAPSLRRSIADYLGKLGSHGHFTRDADGRMRYAFIHGNWCLANARRDGRWCGVDEELPLLHETGCYADFTFPSAPDESQPRLVNQIYWPVGDLARRRAYEGGERARVGDVRRDRLLFIQGPLALSVKGHRLRTRPRLEASAVTAQDPGTPERVRTWVSQGIHVDGRPEWVFVKVHTHGAPEPQAESLLGPGGERLHTALRDEFNDGTRWSLHNVTAREMFNIAIAAMEGKSGNPAEFRDHVLRPPPVARGS
jgi:hypothetical protein